MLQQGRSGSGFLGTALTTAAGVAGGMVLGNMLMGALSGHGGAAQAAGFEGGGGFGQEAVPTSSPWTDPGSAAADQGSARASGKAAAEERLDGATRPGRDRLAAATIRGSRYRHSMTPGRRLTTRTC